MTNEKIHKTLEKIGLSQNERKVYLTLIDYGSTKAGKIAKITNIDRSSCYHALRSLLDKGIISYVIIDKVKWFQGAGPRRLLEYLKEQEEDLKEILPDLQARHKAVRKEGQVRLFKGQKGIKSLFLDIARTKEDNDVFGSEGQFSEMLPEFAKQFERMKQEHGTKTRLLLRKGRDAKGSHNTKYKFMEGIEKSPVVTNICGDKIAIIIWTDDPEGILIENAEAAKAYRSYFNFMWKRADR
jgi:sugar-specific transcriptional regulator TrmB